MGVPTSPRASNKGRTPSLVVWIGLLIMLSTITTTAAQQSDIGPFRLTDVSGTMAVRYLLDEQIRGQSGGDDVFQTRPTIEEELFIRTQSYVYHPGFLNMDIGAGGLFLQEQFDSNIGDNNSSSALFNMAANLNFLSLKDYPFTLYYQRSHPSVSTSLAGRFLVRQTRYGLEASLREPLSPVLMTLEAFRVDTQGSGFDTSIDDIIDEATFSVQKSYRADDKITLTQRLSNRDSKSGSPDLPIQQTISTINTTDIDARNSFGDEGQFKLVQQATYSDQQTTQDFSTDVQDTRYYGNLTWSHSEQTRSFYRYQIQNNRRPGISSRTQAVQIGASHFPELNKTIDGDVHFNRDENEGFDKELAGIRGSVTYTRPFDFGSVQFGAGLSYDRTDQKSVVDFVSVFDENIVLNGITPVVLRNSFVISSSVIVRNIPQTQVFVEGMDYRLVTVGDVTSIERLVGGNIADGQTVLVSYDYRAGGTMNFDTAGQSYSINTRVFDYFNIYLLARDTKNRLRSGTPTTPLNSVRNYQAGLRVDYPLSNNWQVGGELIYTNQDEDIAPFTRDSIDAYVQVSLPWLSVFRATAHKETVDNKASTEDVDMVQYRVALTTRPWGRFSLSVDADYLEDTGGSLRRLRRGQNLSLEWRYRQMRFVMRGQHVFESQGVVEREQTIVKAELSRVF